jgi:hypothetical protein
MEMHNVATSTTGPFSNDNMRGIIVFAIYLAFEDPIATLSTLIVYSDVSMLSTKNWYDKFNNVLSGSIFTTAMGRI